MTYTIASCSLLRLGKYVLWAKGCNALFAGDMEKTLASLTSPLHSRIYTLLSVPRSPRVQLILYSLPSQHNTTHSRSLSTLHTVSNKDHEKRVDACLKAAIHTPTSMTRPASAPRSVLNGLILPSGRATVVITLVARPSPRPTKLNGYRATLHSTLRCMLQCFKMVP